jgi:predicted GNAT family N-acyltransferase
MDARQYAEDDLAACLAVFDSNVPKFYDVSERAGFEEFLAGNPWPYVVLEHAGEIVGCGGWAPEEGGALISMTWGMVRRSLHGNGLGRFLLMYRVREAAKTPGVERVRLSTSQHTAEFFRKQGFKVTEVEKDGFAPGIDRIEMVMKLSVCP